MAKHPGSRPKRLGKSAPCFNPVQVKRAVETARSLRYADRAELLVTMSISFGLRASELASMKWSDVYDSHGSVRRVITATRAFLPGQILSFDLTGHYRLQRLLADFYEKYRHPGLPYEQAPLFSSQRGCMKATSIARHLTAIYRRAGIESGTSRSGRRTMLANLKLP
jgi:integrase/recombinase XerD